MLPHRFSFSKDWFKATITWKNGDIGPAVYDLTFMSDTTFVAEIEGEERLAETGMPVHGQLVLYQSDAFCWHRMDWPPGSCTKPQVRCSAADLGS